MLVSSNQADQDPTTEIKIVPDTKSRPMPLNENILSSLSGRYNDCSVLEQHCSLDNHPEVSHGNLVMLLVNMMIAFVSLEIKIQMPTMRPEILIVLKMLLVI